MNCPIYRPDYDRVLRAYLTHRRATHYDYRINFDRRKGWDDLKRFVDLRGVRNSGAAARPGEETMIVINIKPILVVLAWLPMGLVVLDALSATLQAMMSDIAKMFFDGWVELLKLKAMLARARKGTLRQNERRLEA